MEFARVEFYRILVNCFVVKSCICASSFRSCQIYNIIVQKNVSIASKYSIYDNYYWVETISCIIE